MPLGCAAPTRPRVGVAAAMPLGCHRSGKAVGGGRSQLGRGVASPGRVRPGVGPRKWRVPIRRAGHAGPDGAGAPRRRSPTQPGSTPTHVLASPAVDSRELASETGHRSSPPSSAAASSQRSVLADVSRCIRVEAQRCDAGVFLPECHPVSGRGLGRGWAAEAAGSSPRRVSAVGSGVPWARRIGPRPWRGPTPGRNRPGDAAPAALDERPLPGPRPSALGPRPSVGAVRCGAVPVRAPAPDRKAPGRDVPRCAPSAPEPGSYLLRPPASKRSTSLNTAWPTPRDKSTAWQWE